MIVTGKYLYADVSLTNISVSSCDYLSVIDSDYAVIYVNDKLYLEQPLTSFEEYQIWISGYSKPVGTFRFRNFKNQYPNGIKINFLVPSIDRETNTGKGFVEIYLYKYNQTLFKKELIDKITINFTVKCISSKPEYSPESIKISFENSYIVLSSSVKPNIEKQNTTPPMLIIDYVFSSKTIRYIIYGADKYILNGNSLYIDITPETWRYGYIQVYEITDTFQQKLIQNIKIPENALPKPIGERIGPIKVENTIVYVDISLDNRINRDNNKVHVMLYAYNIDNKVSHIVSNISIFIDGYYYNSSNIEVDTIYNTPYGRIYRGFAGKNVYYSILNRSGVFDTEQYECGSCVKALIYTEKGVLKLINIEEIHSLWCSVLGEYYYYPLPSKNPHELLVSIDIHGSRFNKKYEIYIIEPLSSTINSVAESLSDRIDDYILQDTMYCREDSEEKKIVPKTIAKPNRITINYRMENNNIYINGTVYFNKPVSEYDLVSTSYMLYLYINNRYVKRVKLDINKGEDRVNYNISTYIDNNASTIRLYAGSQQPKYVPSSSNMVEDKYGVWSDEIGIYTEKHDEYKKYKLPKLYLLYGEEEKLPNILIGLGVIASIYMLYRFIRG